MLATISQSKNDGREIFVEKILHALYGDLYTPFRAPRDGRYTLVVEPAEEELTLFAGDRWREAGKVDELLNAPRSVVWADGSIVNAQIQIRSIGEIASKDGLSHIECEPNDSPSYAQQIPIGQTADETTLQIFGTHDEVEYFDNGHVGNGTHDDWLRLDFHGSEPRLLTACLTIPDQMVAARIRVYELPLDKANVVPGAALDVGNEYEDGKNPNERVHQQQE